MPARRAYLVLAHHQPRQLRWLIEAIASPDSQGDRDLVLLHVDLKSMLGLKADREGVWPMAKALAAEFPNVHLMRPRFTNWGGWSLSRIHLDAIDRALDMSPDWSHFINLSGQCFPIKSRDDIDLGLAAHPDHVFVELRHFDTLPADDWHLKRHPMIELPHKAVKLRGPRRPPAGFELSHKGSQWSILPREFCEWQRTARVTQDIRRYLSRFLLSDELVVQCLVRNGPWRDRVAPHLGHAIVWPGPKIMTSSDLPMLMDSPAFFSRKFDVRRDPDVLQYLARTLGYVMTHHRQGLGT